MAKSSTTWQKGQSGNPAAGAKRLDRCESGPGSIRRLPSKPWPRFMQDAKAPHSARVAAAEALARGWGKPQQSVDLAIEQVTPADLAPDLAQLYRATVPGVEPEPTTH